MRFGEPVRVSGVTGARSGGQGITNGRMAGVDERYWACAEDSKPGNRWGGALSGFWEPTGRRERWRR